MDMVYRYFVKDPTEVFVKDEAHSARKRKSRKRRLIWALSLSDNLICKLIFGHCAKNSISQFSRDVKESVYSGIAIGHDDAGLEKALQLLLAMHSQGSSGHVLAYGIREPFFQPLGYPSQEPSRSTMGANSRHTQSLAFHKIPMISLRPFLSSLLLQNPFAAW